MVIDKRLIIGNCPNQNNSFVHQIIFFLVIIWCLNPVFIIANNFPRNFRTINISNDLSHNMVNAIFKDQRGFIWLGTQLGLDRFDGINVVNYPLLKDHSVFTINETDSIYLWVGIDKGLVKLNRKTEEAEYIKIDDKQPTVRALYPVSSHTLLVGTLQGLYIIDNDKIQNINLGIDALSKTNAIYGIIAGKEDKTYWISTHAGLVHFDLSTRKSTIYKYSEDNTDMNNYYCLTMSGNRLYIGTRNTGIVTFDTLLKRFEPFPYNDNPYITTIDAINDSELCVGTNGNGLKIISMQTGQVLESIEHTSDKSGISSNAVYSFLKDGDIFWVGTYMGGLNYTPVIGDRFLTYSFGNQFHSLHHNVRSFWITGDGRKFIGTRDGFIYITEKDYVVRRYTSKTSILRADIILSVYPLNDTEILLGTYGGGLYRFNSSTQMLSYYNDNEIFRRGSFPAFVKDPEDNLWISSSHGVFVQNSKNGEFIHYTNTNSSLQANDIFFSMIDSNNRIWFGTGAGVHMFDLNSKSFRSDMFPAHIQANTGSIRFIFEDSDKNLWFCDNKEGVTKADQSFGRFEHYTTADFLPSNSVTSIIEDDNKGLWFSTQRGLLYYRDNGNDLQFYSLYDGIPGYIFNNPVQITSDGTIWWGNEQGLVYYNKIREKNTYRSLNKPAITTISVAGKTLHASDEDMSYAPPYLKEISISSGQSIEFTFSALNYSQVNTDIYEYQLEGYDKGWQVLMTGNKATYASLSNGKYVFRVKSSSNPNLVTSLIVHVRWNVPTIIWFTIICLISVVLLIFLYSRLLAKHRQIKRKQIAEEEINSTKEKYAKVRMEDTEVIIIRKKLLHYMEHDKPYLNPELKLQDVSNAIDCSPVEISQLLNIHLNTNFADFVNQYRINEFIIRVQDKSAVKYTLTSLSEQSGFSSRTSFFRSFKKIKGTTPAEYIKEMGVNLKN